MNCIPFPFIYLDSSSLLRSNINPEIFKRKALEKDKLTSNSLLKKITTLSSQDDEYYRNICRLVNKNIISNFITLETINQTICNDEAKKIFLFGKKPQHFNYVNMKHWILWGEEISHSNFYKAAMAIADSKCVVIDEKFLSLDIGRQLMHYITSKCTVFVLGDKKYDGIENAFFIKMSPNKFVEELIFRCN